MPAKKITRKVITKVSREEKPVTIKEEPETQEKTAKTEEASKSKKACFFCTSKTQPVYTDANLLRRFTSDRSKITSRAKSGLCARHQRAVTRNIKYARHLGLLPFTPQV